MSRYQRCGAPCGWCKKTCDLTHAHHADPDFPKHHMHGYAWDPDFHCWEMSADDQTLQALAGEDAK